MPSDHPEPADAAARWDARYAAARAPLTPAPAVLEAVAGLAPGTAVDLAAGAGRHAIALGTLGWSVTAVDVSAVGLRRAADEAARRGVALECVVADATVWQPDGPVDLVLAAYVQLGVAALRRAAGWLAPGGHLVAVGHAAGNLDRPGERAWNPAYLHRVEDLRAAAGALVVERLEEVDRDGVVEVVLVARA